MGPTEPTCLRPSRGAERTVVYARGVTGARSLALSAVAVVAVGTAAAAAGPGRPAPAGEQQAVEKTVRAAVYAAVRHDNYRRACRFATARGRQRLIDGVNSSSGPDFTGCPEIIADEVENYPETVRKLRHGLVVSNIRVKDGRATLRVAEGTGPFDGDGRLSLVKADGRWRIDNSGLIPQGD
jgi:hypothetical protein